MSTTAVDTGTCIYLHLSDSSPVDEEEFTFADGKTGKVLWKDVLVEGEYPMSPGPNGAKSEPMRVIAEGESNATTKTISMSDLLFSHEDGAFKYVTIPTTHKDGVLDNTGYVPRPKGLRVVDKHVEGDPHGVQRKVMQSALGFTEPDIAGKVRRGTIPDVSAGIFFNWLNKHSKKMYRAAMKHVALTPTPFMGNLEPFAPVYASDDDLDSAMTAEWYTFDDGSGTSEDSSSSSKGEIVWSESEGMNWLRDQVNAALRPDPPADDRPYVPSPYYWVKDVGSDKALVREEFKGRETTFVIPFTKTGDGVDLAPQTRWVESKEAMIAASDDVPFEQATPSFAFDAITTALRDFETQGFQLSVEEVTLDNRARIKNTESGSEYVARFYMSDGEVRLAPSSEWDQVKKPDTKPQDDAKRPALSAPVVKLSDDKPLDETPEQARLRVARQRRRQLVA